MSADRKALEEAIAYYRTAYPGDGSEHWHDAFKVVFAAAEAHLLTLPKTKMVWEVCATDRLSEICQTQDEALALAARLLGEGRVIRLSRLEIPDGSGARAVVREPVIVERFALVVRSNDYGFATGLMTDRATAENAQRSRGGARIARVLIEEPGP